MRNVLLLILGLIDFGASVPYFLDIIKRKTKPNIASWTTATLINGIAVVAAFMAGGATNTVILSVSYFISTLIIVGLALYKGTRNYTRFDAICQTLAVIGVVIWLQTQDPDIALAFVIIVSEIAFLPTLRHAYKYPNEETWSTFAVGSLVALATLCLAKSWNFAALAVPMDLVIGNGILAATIVIRQRKQTAIQPIA